MFPKKSQLPETLCVRSFELFLNKCLLRILNISKGIITNMSTAKWLVFISCKLIYKYEINFFFSIILYFAHIRITKRHKYLCCLTQTYVMSRLFLSKKKKETVNATIYLPSHQMDAIYKKILNIHQYI